MEAIKVTKETSDKVSAAIASGTPIEGMTPKEKCELEHNMECGVCLDTGEFVPC